MHGALRFLFGPRTWFTEGVDREGTHAGRAHVVADQLQTERNVPSFTNDPSAGSPTETLLRLLLPLNDQV
jgi:hypothetical protein